MISITSFPKIKSYSNKQSPQNKKQSFQGYDCSDILSKGDKALNENRFQEALKYYQEAQSKNPDDYKTYRKVAKAQFHLKEYALAEKNYQEYLQNTPEDIEAWIELGETQRQAGYYQKALTSFNTAQEMDSSNDLARRSILETKNNMLSIFSPQQAINEKKAYAAKNLQEALNMTIKFMTPEYMKDLQNVSVQFGETALMGGTANIAQYENYKKAITISNSYIYASPQVIAAYLSHEAVHAKDNDAYTSIREEQDAYEVAAKFWMQNSNGIKDPEMDYAVTLYKQSPSVLSNRVAEIYTLRDPSIAKTSPNHPPENKFHINPKSKKVASQPVKQYDVIA